MRSYIIPFGLIVLAQTGCTPSSPVSARLELRDALTLEPVAQAAIRQKGLTFYLPTSQSEFGEPPGATFGPLPDPAGDAAPTDDEGHAHLVLAGNRPNALAITAAGYAPLRLLVETDATGVTRPLAWTSGLRQPVDTALKQPPRTLEARFLP